MDEALDSVVDQLRDLIGDPAGSTEVFDRDQIELALNRHRFDAVRYPLEYVLSSNGAGAVRVYSILSAWADDAVLLTGGGVAAVPDVIDGVMGSWSFNAPHAYPLYITGRTFDLYATAADLLEQWAAKLKLQHTISIGDVKLERGQKRVALLEQAKLYRQRARIQSVPIIQDSGLVGDYRKLTAPPPM